ncbi:MAG: polyprenyl synthetase family protein [Terriglobales bacterium]
MPPVLDHLTAFHRTFREAHSLSQQLVRREFRRQDPAIAELMQYILRKQSTSEYPFVFQYSFCRKESDGRRVGRLAAAVQLLQSSALVTDDIFDDARLRYGQPAVHVRYGVSGAILAAELMQSVALKVLGEELERGRFRNKLAVGNLFNQIVLDLYRGQYLDVANTANLKMARREYDRVIALGVGNYVANVAKCGGLLAGKSPREVASLERYGYHYGMAVFITDDIVDVRPPAVTGKSYAMDLRNRRMRLPVILALRMASRRDAAFLRSLYGKARPAARDVRRAVGILRRGGALTACKREAARHVSRALAALRGLRQSMPVARLRWLAETLMQAQGLEGE